jgi:hypothetical protein
MGEELGYGWACAVRRQRGALVPWESLLGFKNVCRPRIADPRERGSMPGFKYFRLICLSYLIHSCSTISLCQEPTSAFGTIYTLSDTANQLIQSNCDLTSDSLNWACMFMSNVEPYQILIFSVPRQFDSVVALCSGTCHRLNVDGTMLPLIFFTDIKFSNHTNQWIKDPGVIQSSSLRFGGYRLTYRGGFMSGTVLQSGWDQ